MYEYIQITFVSLILSSLIYPALIYSGNYWAKTFSEALVIFTLPLITFVITNLISGNIALSLGMVGALSIVRFRHPVRSSFELIVYFLLITLGIALAVNLKFAIALTALFVSIIIFFKFFDLSLIKFFNLNFFNTSFTEGNQLNTLTIESKSEIDYLSANKMLIGISKSDFYLYRFSSKNRAELTTLYNEIKQLDCVKEIDLKLV